MDIRIVKKLLTLDITFDPARSAADVATAVATLEAAIRERYPNIKRIYIEAGRSSLAAPLPTSS